jgi:hypothetical protein
MISDRIACVHMSGLLVRSHMNAGQDGFRDWYSKHTCGLLLPFATTATIACLGVTPASIDRSYHLSFLASSCIS